MDFSVMILILWCIIIISAQINHCNLTTIIHIYIYIIYIALIDNCTEYVCNLKTKMKNTF